MKNSKDSKVQIKIPVTTIEFPDLNNNVNFNSQKKSQKLKIEKIPKKLVTKYETQKSRDLFTDFSHKFPRLPKAPTFSTKNIEKDENKVKVYAESLEEYRLSLLSYEVVKNKLRGRSETFKFKKSPSQLLPTSVQQRKVHKKLSLNKIGNRDILQSFITSKMSGESVSSKVTLVPTPEEDNETASARRKRVKARFQLASFSRSLGQSFAGGKPRTLPVVNLKVLVEERIRKLEDNSFVYMTYVHPRSSELFTPYTLAVVPFTKVNKEEYLTMSRHGVTYWTSSENNFTELDIWMDEFDKYSKLVKITTFKKYRKWKTFTVWKKTIQRKKFIEAQKYLQENLYMAIPALGAALLEIRAKIIELIELDFVDISLIEGWSLFYFMERQMDACAGLREKLEQYHQTVRELLAFACAQAIRERGFLVEDEATVYKTARKMKEMMSFTDRANKRRFCTRLCGFLYLIDYMTICMLGNILHNTFVKLAYVFKVHDELGPTIEDINESYDTDVAIEKLRPEGKPQKPLFKTELVLKPDIIEIDPPKEITMDIVQKLIELIMQSTYMINRFQNDEIYNFFVEPSIMGRKENRLCGEPPKFEHILEMDEEFSKNKKLIPEMVNVAYEKVFLYIKRFDSIRKNYKEDLEMSSSIIRSETDLGKLNEYCERYIKEIDTLERMIPECNLGLLHINQDVLKRDMLPVCKELQTVLNVHLPILARQTTKAVQEAAEKIHDKLMVSYEEAKQIANYMHYLDQCGEKIQEVQVQLHYAYQILRIMKEHEVQVLDDLKDLYLDVEEMLANLSDTLAKKIESKPLFINKLSKSLENDIRKIFEQVEQVREEIVKPMFLDENADQSQIRETLAELLETLSTCQDLSQEYKKYQKEFKINVTRFDTLDVVNQEVKLRQTLWDSVSQWKYALETWYETPFHQLDVEELISINTKILKNCGYLEKNLPKNHIVPKLKADVEDFKEKLPVLGYLRNSNLKKRHWIQIEQILNKKLTLEETLTIFTFEDANAFEIPYSEHLGEISGQAIAEAGLESLLKKVESAWKEYELSIVKHRDYKDVYILAGIDELQNVLDESSINITTILASRHVGPIKPRVLEWEKSLELFSETLDEWVACQKTWMYLEAIFTAPDIQRQLPEEARIFSRVDKVWKEIMRGAIKTPLAISNMTKPGVLEIMKTNNALLEQVTRSLEAYLEMKRTAFPRFYFLSNDELLEILAQTRNPHAVQPHLRKCFDAIAQLKFKQIKNENGEEIKTNDITAMISPEGEMVTLQGLKARGAVEDWLSKVEKEMIASLKRFMKLTYRSYGNKERSLWFQEHPNQLVLTVSQQQWAASIHDILDNESDEVAIEQMKELEKQLHKNLMKLAAIARSDISKLLRKVLCALITLDVHAKDMVTNMVDNKVTKSTDFDWLKLLRYYWLEETEIMEVKMASTGFPYFYEYLGASGVLVITPLTDRCYLCLMGALQMDLGGAPAGPAGTGKTETTKNLAKALAIQCVVFNCSEGLDYRIMGRFFSGLAQSGAWCCFDEFNRIDIEVLSVIAQQLITIKNAKAMKLSRFMFEGREIKLVQSCATFITMNPGYAGRTELPDNLKALFRPISMMVPDYTLIAEVILYSEGFNESKTLAQKMVQLYKLCSEQLSQQDHYDFGMRAVKSVLVMAGALKRSAPNQSENITLIRALRDSNLPKFLKNDKLLFTGILNDLFPDIELPESNFGPLEESIVSSISSQNLQPVPKVVTKTIQLYETMIVRWGVMIVGPTGGGKSCILQTLANALTKLYQDGVQGPHYRSVRTQILNPKCVSLDELYGAIDSKTLEWKDGLLGMAVRSAVNESTSKEIHQWVVCDGPVDAVWVENLNTVLDDNKMLCLPNSERIKLTPWVHMLFEVTDLSQASPATVSRCGMIYVDPVELGWKPLIDSWLNKFSDTQLTIDLKLYLKELCNTYLDNVINFTKKISLYSIHQIENSKVKMFLILLQSLIQTGGTISQIDKDDAKDYLCKIFFWSMLWSIGCNYFESAKMSLEQHIRSLAMKNMNGLPADSLWNYQINPNTKAWEKWEIDVPSFKYDPAVQFYDMLIPTSDTVRFGKLAEILFNQNYPVMLTGDTGVGKSILAKAVLSKLSTVDVIPVFLNFSAQTRSLRTQEIIEASLEKRKKTMLGAPLGKRTIVFVDDVNMPKLDKFGSQPSIELLRQFLDYKGFFDRKKGCWKNIVDVILGVACGPPGGGRNQLSPRFVRHFGLLHLSSPNTQMLISIFKPIIKGHLEDFAMVIKPLADPIVEASIEVYERVTTEFLPTPNKSHYIFNLRDLSKCIQGVLQADASNYGNVSQILRLFYHESMRVFHDRLVSDEDKACFKTLMNEICEKYFETQVVNPDEFLIFGDFMVYGQSKEDRIYEEIKEMDKLTSILTEYLEDYNSITGKEMKLILFQDAIEHIARIARLLRIERGNGLLVGVSGMGKQSLSRLAAHLNGYECVQIRLSRGYDQNSFHEDLRNYYYNAGTLNKPTVFLLSDSQIVEEEFLEDINNLLNSGEIPNLFEGDEYEKVILNTRQACTEANHLDTSHEGIFEFFIKRVKTNLHVILCMSPVGDVFRRRCRMFPSLVNCCTIDWFLKWPSEALLSVALGSLKETTTDFLQCENLSNMCVMIHENVEEYSSRLYNELKRYYYTTPSSYLELLKQYHNLLEKRNIKITSKMDRITNGLNKLLETNVNIEEMSKNLQKLVPVLEEKGRIMKEMLAKLDKENTVAEVVKKAVLKDEAEAKTKATETQEIADEAARELELVMPMFRMAQAALEKLSKADISEVRSFKDPPKPVKFVMEAVCILLGAKPDWNSAKTVMSDTNFLKRLQDYDKEHIAEEKIQKLKPYLDDKGFDPAVVERYSKTAKSICVWVRAIDRFAAVFKEVEPKIRKRQQAEIDLKQVMKLLKEKQTELAGIEEKIEGLKSALEERRKEYKIQQDEMDLTNARLNRAARLTSALSDEEVRWKESIEVLSKEHQATPGDVLIASAYVAYLGAFPFSFRRELLETWVSACKKYNIPSSLEFSLIKTLGETHTIASWNMHGLPKDDISIENGIIVTQASRWSLIIDPQEQANRWIRNLEQPNELKIAKMADPNLMKILEKCIRQGYPLLLEELDETIDPVLMPILAKQISLKNGNTVIQLGDTVIDYGSNFKLYMTTKLPNPHYLPEVCIRVTLVNFLISKNGLEDQLLADIVRIELPELEQKRNDLITKINADKSQLLFLEDKVLKLLYTTEGSILDNEVLVETLNEAKETSTIILSRLEDTEKTEITMTAQRETYRPLAARGTILFLVITSLAEIDSMYQFSLQYFTQMFCTVIREDAPKMKQAERLKYLLDKESFAVYENISKGLFEKHKIIFSFLMATALQKHENKVSDAEFEFLFRGPIGKKYIKKENPDSKVSDQQWFYCEYLEEKFKNFKGLCDDVVDNIKITLADFTLLIKLTDRNRDADINWDRKLTAFQKLMLIFALKREQFMIAIVSYVRLVLGKSFTEPQKNMSLKAIYQDITATTPLIFLLSAGSDPMQSLQKFALEKDCLDKLYSISLGQGQGPAAEKLFERARIAGNWVFLQNCHLATSWMPAMEQIIKEISLGAITVHPDLRIFLSSMPTKSFPVSVLQNSVKITNEQPKGLKANLIGSLNYLDEDFFDFHILRDDWRRMVFGICMFHGVILERRKFGPLGWNVLYEFNESDRNCALRTLDMFCDREVCKKIPWDALQYINGEITYGGRVTDNWDQRCLRTLLQVFSSPKVLVEDYQYSASEIYKCPNVKTLQEFRQYAQNLPFIEPPEIFGMNENANIVYQMNDIHFFINTILDIQPVSNIVGTDLNADDMCLEFIDTIRQNIVKKIFVNEMHPVLVQYDVKNRLPPLTTVLLQEVERFNKLLEGIHDSLNNLAKAVKGISLMSEELESIYKSILKNQVPDFWASIGFLSTKALSGWVVDLQQRNEWIQSWVNYGSPNSHWISGFFFPQSFLTGVLQTHARRFNLPINSLLIDFEVLDQTLIQSEVYEKRLQGELNPTLLYHGIQAPNIGIIIHGLFIEAGRWNKIEGGIVEGHVGQLHPRLPVVWLKPCSSLVVGARYETPLYKTGMRAGNLSTTGHSTNFIMSILLESNKPPEHWILQGTALITLTSD